MSTLTLDAVRETVAADDRNKVDYLTFVNNLHALPNGTIAFTRKNLVEGTGRKDIPFYINDWAESQLLGKLGMPTHYFRKIRTEAPDLYADHFNYWKQRQEGVVRLRARDTGDAGIIRGVVSDRFSMLDNHIVIDLLADILQHYEGTYEINNFTLNEQKFHLRISYEHTQAKVGDITNDAAVTVPGSDLNRVGTDFMNSEVGASSLNVAMLIWRLICSNGLRGWGQGDDSFRQRHMFVDVANVKDRMRETVAAQLHSGQEYMENYRDTRLHNLDNPFIVITKLSNQEKHTDGFVEVVKECWEGEPTAYGIINAYTRAGRDLPLDSRLEVENFAGRLVRLSEPAWQELDKLSVGNENGR